MANPYSDLTGSYIGANYNRAIDPNSQYGTRRQKFYVIEIGNYDIEGENGWSTEQGTAGEGPDDGYRVTFDDDYTTEFLESPYSILYPILRALAIKAEVYLSGEPYTDGGDTYITVAVAQDTIVDAESDFFNNTNSWWLEDVIADALNDFSFSYVNVYQAHLYGYELDVSWGSNALAGTAKKAKPVTVPEAKAARVAAGKLGAPKK